MVEMVKDTWQLIGDRMKQLKKLHDRMDDSKALAYMDDFKMRNYNSTEDLANVINVTGNHPAVLATAIISDLQNAKWQTVVEGGISSRQAHGIEQFIEDNFAQADEFLLNRFGISSLEAWLCNHVCIRSLIGVRWVSSIVGKEYTIDCLPVDMRWTAFRFGKNGLSWVAPISFSNKEDLFEEYPDVSLGSKETDIEVRDYWTDKVNETWVEKKKVFEQKHRFEKPPFVIVFPSVGFMLRDKDYLEHEAEDLFFLNRKLYDEMNRSLSVDQTLGFNMLYPKMAQEQKDYRGIADPIAKAGEVMPYREGEVPQPIPQGDLNRAALTSEKNIARQIELGGISDAELGSAALDRPGIWFAKQFEIRHKLEKARFEALAIMKEGLAHLMIDQFLKVSEKGGASEIRIGRQGKKNKFSAKMLGDPDNYRISFKYGMSSKEMEIINLAQAQAARGIVPERYIVRDILKAEDPDGWFRELEMEKAKQANPALGLAEMAVRYAEEAEDTEDEMDADLKKWQSMMLVHDYVMIMRQRIQPQQPQTLPSTKSPEVKPNMQGLVGLPKLLGQSGMTGRKQEQPVEVSQQ